MYRLALYYFPKNDSTPTMTPDSKRTSKLLDLMQREKGWKVKESSTLGHAAAFVLCFFSFVVEESDRFRLATAHCKLI